ncbi:TadE/TadG family type IV pilus assembly protein [Rubellimicrobium roseum]|uniref:TadE-like domain-containing protein n=1 Tax=Rubellimicrobium roseum TaxID=687525 RepID=A0A5C4NE06_9RHOB|nr:TadE/TadG family type IV pilus assembly protein [Rubellimicrobium roseum]TNC72971.1 hypothetical protein FHG71_06630 [Rubellimicrobium roseum]
MRSRPCRFLRRFAREEEGSVTIETVLWFPVIFWLMLLIADASLAFFAKAQAFRIIQDANRAYSTQRLEDTDDVAAWIKERFRSFSPGATVRTQLVQDGMLVQTDMAIPVRDVVRFNSLGVPANWTINLSAQHYVE